MPIQVIMPQLGESVIEGTITKWLKATGEPVKEYEPLLEINTDKVDSEIPSPAAGTLLQIMVPEGTTVRAGTLLAWIGAAQEETPSGEAAPVDETRPIRIQPAPEPVAVVSEPAAVRIPAGQNQDLGFISPVVARMAQENRLDLHGITGTGQNGRITKKDVLAYLENRPGAPYKTGEPIVVPFLKPVTLAPTPTAAVSQPASLPAAQVVASVGDEVIPLNPVRRAIAEHMVFSERTSPHVTTVMEADLSRVVAHREAHKASFARDGANLTFSAYFMAAAVAALQAHRMVNSSWTDKGILMHKSINIGMATSMGEEGLIVPVIKNADSLSLLGLARQVNDLSGRARQHKLLPDEVKNGTFTITNHGTSGSLFATPIINQPQCAILGVGIIQKRAIVISSPGAGDSIAIRPMVYISLTFDHRILDGASGDAFLGKVIELLENWE